MDNDMIQNLITQIIYLLSLVEVGDLEEYVAQMNQEHAHYDVLMPILNPTFYRDEGVPIWLEEQTQIVRHLLVIRQGIEAIKTSTDAETMLQQVRLISSARANHNANKNDITED